MAQLLVFLFTFLALLSQCSSSEPTSLQDSSTPPATSMFEKEPAAMNIKAIRTELSSLYGIRDFSDCLELKDLQDKLTRIRDTRPITYGYQYGPIIEHGNTKNPSGLVFLSHGLGDSARGWDDVGQMLARRLPHLLFLLPTAPDRQVTMNGGMSMPAWYDIFDLSSDLINSRQDGEGVLQSVQYLSSLAHVKSKALKFPIERVVYAGFSQGAAVSLAAGLTVSVPPAGIVSMSGYLAGLSTILPLLKNKVPIAMFHGTQDPVVPLSAAKESRDIIQKELGVTPEFSEYRMQHSAVPEEIEALTKFIEKVLPKV